MLRVELACQEFDRASGHLGKTSWPIDITEDQLTELMAIPAVWTPNTRAPDQLDGVALWAIKNVLLLTTVLQSWKKQKPWSKWLLQCFETDPELSHEWELRMIWSEDTNALSNEVEDSEIMLTDIIRPDDYPQFDLLPGELINKEAIRKNRRDHAIVAAMFRRLQSEQDDLSFLREEEDKPLTSRGPFDLSVEDIDILVSNFGQEDQLW